MENKRAVGKSKTLFTQGLLSLSFSKKVEGLSDELFGKDLFMTDSLTRNSEVSRNDAAFLTEIGEELIR